MNVHSKEDIMNKKELIRESAIKVIASEGYYNTTIKMIAKDAGIAVGTIYNYFKNKDEIIDYIFKVEHEKRIKFLNEMVQGKNTIFMKIETFLDFHFNDLEDNQNVGKVLIQESMMPSKRSIEGVERFLVDLPVIFAKMLKEAHKKNEIREIDYNIISNAIFHAIRGVVYTLESSNKEKDYKKAKEELYEFILKGICK